MLTIILTILQILGIVMLVLLCVILLTILVILFVPIRYGFHVEHGDDFCMKGRISWLLHFIHIKISHNGGRGQIRVRVLGKIVYDSLKKKTKVSIVRKRRRKKKHTEFDVPVGNEMRRTDTPDTGLGDSEEREEYSNNHEKRQENKNKKEFILIRIFRKVIAFLKKVRDKLIGMIKSVLKLKRNIGRINEFIHDEINKEAFKLIFSSFKKVLKHIFPKKINSQLIFGTGDPCSTGQALGVFGFFYSIYGDKVRIVPDFENRRFEGKHIVKGRIRIFTVLIIGIKLILDKRFKAFKRNIKTFKEAL